MPGDGELGDLLLGADEDWLGPVVEPPPEPEPPVEEEGEGEGEGPPPPAAGAPAFKTRMGADVYGELEPLAAGDPPRGWPLLCFVDGVASMWEQVEVCRSDGRGAWYRAGDVKTAPAWLLPFLGLFVGATVTPGLPASEQRQQIEAEAAWHRQYPSSMESAIARTLTGSKRVRIIERRTSAYTMLIVTDPAETPSPALTETVARDWKPGGSILTFELSADPLIDEGTRVIDAAVEGTIDTATLAEVT